MIGTVVLDWRTARDHGVDASDLNHRIERLLAAGVDVVVSAADGDDAVPDPGLGPGPGRLAVRPAPASGPASGHELVVGGGDVLARLDEVLDEVLGARANSAFPEPEADPAWRIEVAGFDAGRERDVESWLTVANGRSGTRGALEEGRPGSDPAMLLAGIFGRVDGGEGGVELVSGPDWTRLHPALPGHEPLDLGLGDTLEHRRVLDMRTGTVLRYWRQRLPSGREWSFRSARFASLAERHLTGLEAEARLDGHPVALDADIPLPARLEPLESVTSSTPDNGHVVVSLRARGGGAAALAVATREEGGRLERLASLARSFPAGATDPVATASEGLARATGDGLVAVRARHRRAWRGRWAAADVVVDGEPDIQRALRFALYHLISSGDHESDLASIGARGLSGAGYRGHVFWDTEIFVLPFFIWTHAPTARALLAYRHRTLPAARAKAAAEGYRGALFAWESADTGEEVTPRSVKLPDGSVLEVRTGLEEHHISADVAWAAWQYWLVTGDVDFLAAMGAELVVETARFWASRARPDADGRYHIDRVIGPDEYHETVDDNVFTNLAARWNLRTAAEVCDLLPGLDQGAWEALVARTGLGDGERAQWATVAAGLVDGFDAGTGVHEQFAGYFDLEDIRAVDIAPRPFAGEAALGLGRLRASQVVKQADAVMAAHLFPDDVPPAAALADYRYYEPRTSHGSSLSPAIHAAVAARLGLADDALHYFRLAAAVDLGNRMGNAAQGVHVATMGGLWQAAVMGFGGVRAEAAALRIDPRPHPAFPRLRFPLGWRGARVEVEVGTGELRVRLDGPARVAVGDGPAALLGPGRSVARRAGEGWGPLTPAEDGR